MLQAKKMGNSIINKAPQMPKGTASPIGPIPAKVQPTVIKGGRSGPSVPYETNPGSARDVDGPAGKSAHRVWHMCMHELQVISMGLI